MCPEYRFNYVRPKRLVVAEGQSAYFYCAISTNDPLTWYKDGDTLPQHINIHESNIFIEKVKKEDEGYYECFGEELSTQKYIKGIATLIVGSEEQ